MNMIVQERKYDYTRGVPCIAFCSLTASCFSCSHAGKGAKQTTNTTLFGFRSPANIDWKRITRGEVHKHILASRVCVIRFRYFCRLNRITLVNLRSDCLSECQRIPIREERELNYCEREQGGCLWNFSCPLSYFSHHHFHLFIFLSLRTLAFLTGNHCNHVGFRIR